MQLISKRLKKIAIIANMSAGKSEFLNSLFGEDVLPTSNEAMSDCPIYIYSDNDSNNNGAQIFFDNKDSVYLTPDEVKKDLKEYAKKDALNTNEQYMGVEYIKLFWDFSGIRNSNNSYDFVIIDTPGMNNTGTEAAKHQRLTSEIINNADMFLYLFDYGQIDANLSKEQGTLWNILIEQKKLNTNLQVMFIINKIDKALDDNLALCKNDNDLSSEVLKYWFYNENKAINKLKKVAKEYGFNSDMVFIFSAKYTKLSHIKKLNRFETKEYNYIKDLFEDIFQDKAEYELNKYLDSSNIENAFNMMVKQI